MPFSISFRYLLCRIWLLLNESSIAKRASLDVFGGSLPVPFHKSGQKSKTATITRFPYRIFGES